MKTIYWAIIGLSAFAITAQAQDTTIPFEDLDAGAKATDRYASQGVVFDPQGWIPFAVKVPAGVAESGITVANITCSPACSNEFPVAFARGFLQGFTRRHVKVFVGGLEGPWNAPAIVRMIAYNPVGKIVATSQPVSITAGTGIHTPIEVTASTNSIASFVIQARSYYDVNKKIAIDDLSFDASPAGGVPDFTIAASPTSVTVLRSSSASVPFTIARLNGSVGPITLTTGALPAGVTASFTPASVDAISSTLTLSADEGAPMISAAIDVIATPSVKAVGSGPKSLKIYVNVRSFFTVSLGVRLPFDRASLHGCASVVLPIRVIRDFSFGGTVALRADNLPAGVHATFSESTVGFPGGNAESDATVTFTADPGTPLVTQAIRIVGSGVGAPESGFTVNVATAPAVISAVSPTLVWTPRELKPGTEVTIAGQGFCPGASVQFGNGYARATPVFVSATGDQMKAIVPRLATSGFLTLVFPDSTMLQAPDRVTVSTYRNQNGYSFHNLSDISVEFDDVDELFGDDQTHIAIDFCWPFGCSWTTPIPSPLAAIFTGIARGALHDGQCFGMSLSAQRILHGDKSLGDFQPPGAPTINSLTSPTPAIPTAATAGASAAIVHYAHVQHIAQLSSEFLHHWLGESALNVSQTGGHIRSQIEDALVAGDHPYISLHHDSDGHVVTAFNIEDDSSGTGGFYVDLYDSNFEFLPDEDANGDTHRSREGYTDKATGIEYGSRLHVKANGDWRLGRPDPSQSWVGSLDEIVVTTYSVVPVRPTMPASFDGLVTLIFGDDATTTQITKGTSRHLFDARGKVNRDAATEIPGAFRFAPLASSTDSSDIYILRGEGSYRQDITGSGKSPYTSYALTADGVTSMSTESAKGSSDEISWRSGMSGIGIRTRSTPRSYRVVVESSMPDSSQRQVTLASTSSAEGDTISFDARRQTVRFQHLGPPTTFQLSLESVGHAGPPSGLQSAELHVLRGDSITISPSDWTRLDTRPVAISIVHADRKAERSTLSTTVHPSAVTISSVAIADPRTSKRRIRIDYRLTGNPSSDAVVVTSWNILRNGRSIGRHVAQSRGEFLRAGSHVAEWIVPKEIRGPVTLVGSVTMIRSEPILNSSVATLTSTAVIP